ncbi:MULTISPECIES: helix-turn-helix domain-containing protein [unclassified Clostridium]|uniref:PucR family transcriptional regulator n=1 Tax=unclassified Clostridium TaxID=2614128 RepID=UPI001899766F|nr:MULTISPECIES: helix-turn-helix domain-containing protein [unclassified Clostridium]MCR1950308.1 helix-turn-helix domain-containing protein [Clostridium sp. DSM 100503]
MGAMVELLNEVCKETNVKMRLLDANNNEIYGNLPTTESKVMRKISVNNKAYKIILEQDDIKIIPMVEYILNKCIKKENIIKELLEARKQWDVLNESVITKSNKMLLIETNKEDEALEIVRDTYVGNDIYVGEIYDRIIVIGNLEDEKDHAFSLKETIIQTLGVNAKISISDLDYTFHGFKRAYSGAVQALEIGRKFKIKPEIYCLKDMYLEKAIFNLSSEYSNDLKEEYKDIFKGFNHELTQTLEEILKCDLSLTKAAKNLYIHRNTLMYRIEKIKKETGFDVRNFKEATFLYILYMNSKRI